MHFTGVGTVYRRKRAPNVAGDSRLTVGKLISCLRKIPSAPVTPHSRTLRLETHSILGEQGDTIARSEKGKGARARDTTTTNNNSRSLATNIREQAVFLLAAPHSSSLPRRISIFHPFPRSGAFSRIVADHERGEIASRRAAPSPLNFRSSRLFHFCAERRCATSANRG